MPDDHPPLIFNNIDFEALYEILTLIRHHKDDNEPHTLEVNGLTFTRDKDSVIISLT